MSTSGPPPGIDLQAGEKIMIISLILLEIQSQNSSSLKRLVKAVEPKSRAPSEIHSGLENFLKPNELPQHIFSCEKQPKFLKNMSFLSLKNYI